MSAPRPRPSARILVERALIARRPPLDSAIGLVLLTGPLGIAEQFVELGDGHGELGARDLAALKQLPEGPEIRGARRDDLSVDEGALVVRRRDCAFGMSGAFDDFALAKELEPLGQIALEAIEAPFGSLMRDETHPSLIAAVQDLEERKTRNDRAVLVSRCRNRRRIEEDEIAIVDRHIPKRRRDHDPMAGAERLDVEDLEGGRFIGKHRAREVSRPAREDAYLRGRQSGHVGELGIGAELDRQPKRFEGAAGKIALAKRRGTDGEVEEDGASLPEPRSRLEEGRIGVIEASPPFMEEPKVVPPIAVGVVDLERFIKGLMALLIVFF